MSFVLSAGRTADSPQFVPVLQKVRVRLLVGRPRPGCCRGRPTGHDADLYKERNTVERLINRLKDWRGIATRFDKTPESHFACLHLRASMIRINDLLKATG